MLHMVMRQRRRFAFALLVTQLALFGVVPQTWILAIMTVGMVVGIGLMTAPGRPVRRIVECGAIGLLASTRMPDPIWMGLAFAVATVAAYLILYSPLLDRLPIRLGLRSRKSFMVAMDRRTAWNKLIPGQGHVAAYWTGTMIASRKDAHDEDTRYLTFENGDDPVEEITITYLKMDPQKRATYLIERDTLVPGEEIIMTYQLTRTEEERTLVFSDMLVSGLPIRHAVERFFDDLLGDELDSFATMTECRRRWFLRQAGDVALMTDLGREGVQLKVDVGDDDEEDIAPKRLMSA